MKAKAPTPTNQKQSLSVREAENEKPVVYKDNNGQEVSLSKFIINHYLAPGADFTEAECWGLIGLAKARGLNPVAKDVYFQRYQGTPQIIVSRDYYEKRAAKNSNYIGKENGIVVLNRKDEIEYRIGTIMLPNETLLGGWCRVYMKNLSYPVFVSVQFEEAVKLKDGKPQATWAVMPKTMIEKVAVVRALRQAMTEEFGGTYSAEELGFDETELETNVQEINTPITDSEPQNESPKPQYKSVDEAIDADYTSVDESTGEVLESSEEDEDDFEAMQKSFFNSNDF